MKAFLIILCFLLVGCQTVDSLALKAGYTSKARAEQAIEKVRQDYAAKQAANDRMIAAAQEAFTKGLNDRMISAAGSLYAADLAFTLHPHPDRTHLVMDNKINEARAVLPPPSVEVMMAQNAEIKRQLDETVTSLESLQNAHEAALKEAAKVTARAAQAEADLAAAKQAKLDIEAAKARELEAKQAALNAANNKVIAAEHERGNDATARHALLTKLSLGAGIFSVLCFAGAIWSPVYKASLGLLGIVVGVCAVGIWYLTGPVVLVIATVSVAGLIGWAVWSYNRESKTLTDTVRAIQRIKENSPEEYAKAVKPELEEANTKYVKQGGEIIKVPDPKREAFIDARLAAVGDK